MKAMILAAGLGTRLRPYTDHRPKALFTLNETPILGLTIEKLGKAGFQSVMVNTHHLHQQIEAFLMDGNFDIPVLTAHEVDILGTGGALRNVADYWHTEPLLVINGDIISDIDLEAVYRFHQHHDYPVTMVMHDHAQFNSVNVDRAGFITGFQTVSENTPWEPTMAFTGIHVLDPQVLEFLPTNGPAHIIDTYRDMLAAGMKIKAHIVSRHRWYDIGTPRQYHRAAVDHMAPLAFEKAFGRPAMGQIIRHKLHGDGSDRRWHRVENQGQTLIMADHGLLQAPGRQEVDAYIAIGRHLDRCGIPVPRIYTHDRCSGLVFVQDLGDQLLHAKLAHASDQEIRDQYCRVIDILLEMAMTAKQGFDPAWTYQSTHYDRHIILEHECRYFLEAFIRGRLGWKTAYAQLASEFEAIADQIEEFGLVGFMHRDFQSRNIMLSEGSIWLVDFQGARLGPLQYDLASLLIDPYAALSPMVQQDLLTYASKALLQRYAIRKDDFQKGYSFCALARNLQILGAFAFLTDTKDKPWFAQFIPSAVQSLQRTLTAASAAVPLPNLTDLAEKLLEEYAH